MNLFSKLFFSVFSSAQLFGSFDVERPAMLYLRPKAWPCDRGSRWDLCLFFKLSTTACHISILVKRGTGLRTNPIIFRATGERDKAWGGWCFPQTVFRVSSWEGRSKRRGPKNNSKAWRWKVQASPGRRSQGTVTSSRQVWSLAQYCLFYERFFLAKCYCLQGQKHFPN